MISNEYREELAQELRECPLTEDVGVADWWERLQSIVIRKGGAPMFDEVFETLADLIEPFDPDGAEMDTSDGIRHLIAESVRGRAIEVGHDCMACRILSTLVYKDVDFICDYRKKDGDCAAALAQVWAALIDPEGECDD